MATFFERASAVAAEVIEDQAEQIAELRDRLQDLEKLEAGRE